MPVPWLLLSVLILTVLALLLVKRWISDHLQELSLRWVGDPDVALTLYFVLFLPGVLVHEVSHWLMARLLGVRVKRLSIGPVRKRGSRRVSLGSVQVANVDPVRASLIGLAPLLGGTVVILLVGLFVLDLTRLYEAIALQGIRGLLTELERVVLVPDLWLWLYLVFSVSNAMLPSESDRAAVRPVLIFLAVITGGVLLVTGIPTVPDTVVRAAGVVATYLGATFALTLVVDLIFSVVMLLMLWLTRWVKGQ